METFNRRLLRSVRIPLLLLAIMWIVQIFQTSTGISLATWGVLPRHEEGLAGIITMPFVHGGFRHIISNSIPFLATSVVILFFFPRVGIWSLLLILLGTGILVWLFAKEAFHIGASGMVYGQVSFIFWSGVFRRNIKSIILAVIVLMLYSGLFAGIFPNMPGVSWEGHLFGAISGIFVAFIFRKAIERDELPTPDVETAAPSPFLDRDIFKD